MNNSSQKSVKPRPHSKRVAVPLFIFLIIVSVLLSTYYPNYVKGSIQQDSKSNLGELGKHISESLTNNIVSTIDVLEALALQIAGRDFASVENAEALLAEQAEFWDFHDIAYIDSYGISHHADGTRDTLNRLLIYNALKSGDTVYDFQVAGDEDCVVFVTPLSAKAQKEKGVLAVSGTYAVRNWDMLMDIDIYDRQAVTRIINSNGVVITRNRGDTGQEQYNFLELLRDSSFEDGMTMEKIEQSFRDGERLQISYRLNHVDYYLIHEPIDFSNWALTFTVPASIVNNSGVNMSQSVVIIAIGLTIVFLAIFMIFQFFQSRVRRTLWLMAYQDTVTGGANKNKFELDANALLAEEGRHYTLVYINIQQFKVLNQRFGKEEADHILRQLQKALTALITNRECVAHLTGDNFVLLLESDASNSVSDRLEAFAAAQSWQTTTSGVPCSIRLLFGLCDTSLGMDSTQLIDQANLAMKSLSYTGKSCLAVYDASMMERAAREKELTERLLDKKTESEFYICLQPKVDLNTGKVIGAEALSRWQSSSHGFISPNEFIPLAEKVGVICRVDLMAFEYVCKTIKMWQKEGKPLIPVSFNLSKFQLAIPDFLEPYRAIIEQYKPPCQYLDFEFTESILYENTEALSRVVSQIHDMGCQCSVDDFGYGYSSLGLLGYFDVDTLKLDRSFFLQNTQQNSRNNLIVRNIIQLADNLGMKTVAEGVEDQGHVDMLQQFGCGSIQGYIFSEPLSVTEFENYVQQRMERMN